MELKFRSIHHNRCTTCGSNRTFMELKYALSTHSTRRRPSSNRTFMELKFDMGAPEKHEVSSNRTFMELKWAQRSGGGALVGVLIVPLWN